MREVNFSSPSTNRASVGITTQLYDRRALDCTSTLPLINSLNHLCYLTQSSARIREILTVDGGVERLISILKNGRSKDMMGTWKWNLALQCIFNIGVRGSDVRGSDNRGSENIRVRVVEADIVPVVATILDNFIQVTDKVRARQCGEEGVQRSREKCASKRQRHNERGTAGHRSSRREAPPPIEIPNNDQNLWNSRGNPLLAGLSPEPVDRPQRNLVQPHRHHHHHHRRHLSLPGHMQAATEERSPRSPLFPGAEFQADLLTVGDANLLPPMTSTSQPDTPLTPQPPVAGPSSALRNGSSSPTGAPRRPSIRHQLSTSGRSDDEQIESASDEPMVEIQDDLTGEAPILEQGPIRDALDGPDVTGDAETGTFNIAHRMTDGSIIDSNTTPAPPIQFSPPTVVGPSPEQPSQATFDRFVRENPISSSMHSSIPRDEDVIMSLQLLAYVSKYSDLRTYFQQSHLVPKLKTSSKDMARLDGQEKSAAWLNVLADCEEEEVSNDREYCQPDDYNIFPLVEKFTVRHHSQEMKYWAGVVLRNLCRKDKSRGYIRQCAYYKCGRWEDYAKQFAKCRRCRQTKYCSKECQKRYAAKVLLFILM